MTVSLLFTYARESVGGSAPTQCPSIVVSQWACRLEPCSKGVAYTANYGKVFVELKMAGVAVRFLVLWLSLHGCVRSLGTF